MDVLSLGGEGAVRRDDCHSGIGGLGKKDRAVFSRSSEANAAAFEEYEGRFAQNQLSAGFRWLHANGVL